MLNLGLLLGLGGWLRAQWRACPAPAWRAALLLGLGGRLAVGVARALPLIKDAWYMSADGRLLTAQLWADPAGGLASLLGNTASFGGRQVVYYGMSNTFFLSKILALLNLATLGTDWLNAAYLSAASLVGCWAAARALARVFPAAPAGAGLLAFVLWPSTIWWASGVSKEAVLLGSGAGVLALFLRLFYDDAPRRPARWLGEGATLLALAVVHFKMRYFFAGPLLAALAALALLRLAQRRGLAQSRVAAAAVLLTLLGGALWLAPGLGPAFHPNKLTNQVIRVYDRHLHASQNRPHFEYPDLRPTTASLLAHAPRAVLNALARPYLGESWRPQYLGGALENTLLLGLLALALLAWLRGRGGALPFGFGLALALHCLLLAAILGLTTPNLGSLARYRSDLLPFLLLLLLQNDWVARVFNPRVGWL